MKLAVVDVGNTSTAVGLWTDGRVSKTGHFDRGFEDASKAVASLFCDGPKRPDAIAYVSVVPKEDAGWRAFAEKSGIEFRQITYKSLSANGKNTLRLDYPKPSTIGADRLADAAGAVERYGAPVLVMDFGTALTAAVVTRDMAWRGGVIAPGFPLMRDYLFERTANLPRMKLGSGKVPKIGRSTEEAMRFGALVGYRGMVREIASTLSRNFGEDFRLVATGGFAKWVLSGIDMPFTIDPTLTLYGAGLICARNF